MRGYVIVLAFIVFIAFIQFHKSNKKKELQMNRNYKRIISTYNNTFSNDFSNEIVYQFISDIDKIPALKISQDIKEDLEIIYNNIKNNKSISEDLKLQLRVTLNLKGIKI